jgi:hydroxymethylbilane synthase
MPPAPGQGALALTCRADDPATQGVLAKISVAASEIAVAAERGFLEALDGSCRTPIGALATIQDGTLSFLGEVLSPDGAQHWRREEAIALGGITEAAALGGITEAAALGRKLGRLIRAEAGEEFIQNLDKRGW